MFKHHCGGDKMRRGIIFSGLMAVWMAWMGNAWADPVDSTAWLWGDYVGVGGIDMPKLSQRRIYAYLMDFFVTDSSVRQAFKIIEDAGIRFEDVIRRVIVAIPADVDRSEHLILWETSEDLSRYHTIFAAYGDRIDKRTHHGMEYYATKRENECLAILGNVLALGSELKVKAILDAHKSGYRAGVTNEALMKELRRTDKGQDAWFAFALDAKIREKMGRTDPIVDMSTTNDGMLNAGDLVSGHVALDFSNGLKASSTLYMTGTTSAVQTAKAMTALLNTGRSDADVKALGFDTFLTSIHFQSSEDHVDLTLNYDQATFDGLIALVTQFVKSVPGQPAAEKLPPQEKKANEAANPLNHGKKAPSMTGAAQVEKTKGEHPSKE